MQLPGVTALRLFQNLPKILVIWQWPCVGQLNLLVLQCLFLGEADSVAGLMTKFLGFPHLEHTLGWFKEDNVLREAHNILSRVLELHMTFLCTE